MWAVNPDATWPRPGGPVIPVMRMAPFAGPYWKTRVTPEAAALAIARFIRDSDLTTSLRGLATIGGFTGGDGGSNTVLASFVRACALVAELTDDAVEREEALSMGHRIAWRMYMAHKGRLPIVYKGNISLTIWIGFAYADLYAVGKDERFREAAVELAKTMAGSQDPKDGAWPGPDKGVMHWPGGVFGPSEVRGNGAEAALWYIGRMKKQFGVPGFPDVEAKAQNWIKTTCLPEMFWQNIGYHSGEMIPVQDSVAPHALSYAIWLLDYAPAEVRDLKLVAELARWSEDRHVNWGRQPASSSVANPSCWGWSRAAGNGLRIIGSLAYVCGRLAQETGDALWQAKSDALVQGILVAQDPLSGDVTGAMQRNAGDVGAWLNYETIQTARHLFELSRMQKKR